MSTLNRTLKSYLLAIIGAEYVLNWLPRGTHDWTRFLKPEELGLGLKRAGFDVIDRKGLRFDPLSRKWALTRDMAVNYMVSAKRVPSHH